MIALELVLCLGPRRWERVDLVVVEGATVADALRLSGLLERHALDLRQLNVGVWGRRQPLDHPVREGDRVEVYRPLQCDPKEARRLRYRRSPGRARRIKRLESTAQQVSDSAQSAQA